MSRLRLIKTPENPAPRRTLIEQARDTEPMRIDGWLRQELGDRAVALWAHQIVGVNEDEPGVPGEMLRLGNLSVAGVFMSMREMQIRIPRAPVRSEVGSLVVRHVALFSTSHGPANIPDATRERMADNDLSIATFYEQVGVSLDEKVAFGPLENNRDEDEEPSRPRLYVVK